MGVVEKVVAHLLSPRPDTVKAAKQQADPGHFYRQFEESPSVSGFRRIPAVSRSTAPSGKTAVTGESSESLACVTYPASQPPRSCLDLPNKPARSVNGSASASVKAYEAEKHFRKAKMLFDTCKKKKPIPALSLHSD